MAEPESPEYDAEPPTSAEDDDDVGPISRTFAVPVEDVTAPPGTLNLASEERPRIFLVDYGSSGFKEKELSKIEDCAPYIDNDSVTWIDLRGIGHTPTFEQLGKIFKIHPLALEDMTNVPQRPKAELYPQQQLFISTMVTLCDKGEIQTEQFAILFGKGFVVTVQEERDVDCLDPVRARIRNNRGIVRKMGSDYLAYALLDAVVDGFYPVLERYGERLDELELGVLKANPTTSSKEIFAMKRELLHLRRAIWPLRDVLAQLLRDESPHIKDETRRYYRDTYDHAVQIMDMVETFREIASSLMDLLMTGASNRLNEVMKVLTIVSTIFLPMTFVAGVYGMNFNPDVSALNMPELNWSWGYPFSLLVMIASVLSLLMFYRARGWIGQPGDKAAWSPAAKRPVRKRGTTSRTRRPSSRPPPPRQTS